MITLTQLTTICPALKGVRGQVICDNINGVFPLYGMLGKDYLNATLANLLHESAELSRFEENLNYSISGLLKTFSRSRISSNQVQQYGRVDGVRSANKKAIANTVYGGAWGRRNLGNTQPNDGWDLRGSGGLQATGRDVISSFTKFYNEMTGAKLTVQQMAVKLRDIADINTTMHFACWFVRLYKNMKPVNSLGEFTGFVRGVNGGVNGLTERQKYYNRGERIL